jgi:hypothetical protein
MRISEEEEYVGEFWLPKYPDRRVPGLIYVSDGGVVKLRVFSKYDDFPKKTFLSLSKYDRILGVVKGGKSVILEYCTQSGSNGSLAGVSELTFEADLLVLGHGVEEGEKLELSRFCFSVDCATEWLGITGIEYAIPPDFLSWKMKFEKPDDLEFKISDTLVLKVKFAYSIPHCLNTKPLKSWVSPYFELESEKELPYSEMISLAFRMVTFLSFANDKLVSVRRVYGFRSEEVDTKEPESIILIYQSHPFVTKEPEFDERDCLFKFSDVEEDFESVIRAWFHGYDLYGGALDLYIATKADAPTFLHTNFLALSQCLEAFHREISDEMNMDEDEFERLCELLLSHCPKKYKSWLKPRIGYGNELGLAKRLKLLMQPFKDLFQLTQAEITKRTRIIADIRNNLTHYALSDKYSDDDYMKMYDGYEDMVMLFKLSLLSQIGFSNKEIEKIVLDSRCFNALHARLAKKGSDR